MKISKLIGISILGVGLITSMFTVPVSAAEVEGTSTGSDSSSSTGSSSGTGSGTISDYIRSGVDKVGSDSTPLEVHVKNIINVILFIIGILAVVMIIYGGLQYTISSGDNSKIATAKNTILYSVVGLIVAILAFAIVNFVINAMTASSGSGSGSTSTSASTTTPPSTNPAPGRITPTN